MALLEAAGKPDWIAHSAAEYVVIAAQLAADGAGRHDWRLRAREYLRPTICDARRLAGELMDALRAVASDR